MVHAFDPALAQEVGIPAAVVLRHVVYWCLRNAREGKHQHDGRTWMFDTQQRLAENFPYLSQATVVRALDKLREAGYLAVGRYNQLPFDRTMWYAATEKGLAIYADCLDATAQKEEIPRPQNEAAIPQSRPQQEIPPLLPPEVDAQIRKGKRSKTPSADFNPVLFDKFWRAYPRKVGKDSATRAWIKLHVGQALFDEIMDGLRRSIQFDRSFREKQYTPYPASWLNGKRWQDEFDLPRPAAAPPSNAAFDELKSIAREQGSPPPPRPHRTDRR